MKLRQRCSQIRTQDLVVVQQGYLVASSCPAYDTDGDGLNAVKIVWDMEAGSEEEHLARNLSKRSSNGEVERPRAGTGLG